MTTFVRGPEEFIRAFDEHNRSENFSEEGRRELYEFLAEVNGEYAFDADVIAYCCGFTESTPEEINEDYEFGIEKRDWEDDEDFRNRVIAKLNEHTIFVGVTSKDTIIYADF